MCFFLSEIRSLEENTLYPKGNRDTSVKYIILLIGLDFLSKAYFLCNNNYLHVFLH